MSECESENKTKSKRTKRIVLTLIIISVLIVIAFFTYYVIKTINLNLDDNNISNQELIEIDTSNISDSRAISVDSNGKYAVLYYTNYITDTDEGEESENYNISNENYTSDNNENNNVSDSAIDDVENNKVHYYISVFDVYQNKLIKTIEFENDDNYNYTVQVDENNIVLTNEQIGQIVKYDFNLENRNDSTYEFIENWTLWQNVDSIDISWFECKSNFAISTGTGNNQSLIFHDNPEEFYMLKYNKYYEYKYAFNHEMLVIDNSNNETETYKSIIRIFDFDKEEEFSSIEIDNNQNFNNVECVNLNKDRVSITTNKDDGKLDKIYVWNYNLNPKNSKFDSEFCNKINSNEIEQNINNICYEVKENYEISLECMPNEGFIKDEYNYDNNVKPILFYQAILDIKDYLSLLPKELYKEILCQDIKNAISSFDEFKIYFVGNFSSNIDAFSSNVQSDETDNKTINYIVYSASNFSIRVFFHELMHSMEYRIWNYEKDFDTNWEILNPKKFDYTTDYVSCYYDESHEEWQKYFIRDYGMKTILEDRATCFEELCDDNLNDDYWWKDKEKIVAKEMYLVEVLKKSFPSLKNCELLNF